MVSSKVNTKKKTGSALKTRDYDFNFNWCDTVTHNTMLKMTTKTKTETTRRERLVA